MKTLLCLLLLTCSARASIQISVKKTDAGLVYVLVTADEPYRVEWSYRLRDWWPIYYHAALPGERASALSALAWAPERSGVK